MTVTGAEHFKQRDSRGIWLNPLTRAVRHIDDGYSELCHGIHLRTMRHKVQNHLVVATGGGIVERCISSANLCLLRCRRRRSALANDQP